MKKFYITPQTEIVAPVSENTMGLPSQVSDPSFQPNGQPSSKGDDYGATPFESVLDMNIDKESWENKI